MDWQGQRLCPLQQKAGGSCLPPFSLARSRYGVLMRILPLAFLMALAACSKADNEPGPGGVTMGEARALDEAAEMIEAQRLPAAALTPAAPAPTAQTPTAPASASPPKANQPPATQPAAARAKPGG